MPVIANCSSCGSKLNVSDDLLGREVRCPRCGTVTVVPPPGEGQRSRAAAERPTEPYHPKGEVVAGRPGARRPQEVDDDRYSDRAPGPDRVDAPAQQNGAALGLGIASLVLGILAIPFALIPCIGTYSIPVSSVGLLLGVVGLVLVLTSKKGSLGFPIAGTAVSAVALAVAGLWFLICAGLMSGAKQGVEELKKGMEEIANKMEEAQRREAADWVDASQEAATHGDVRVRVTSVTLGRVALEGGNEAAQKSAEHNLVIRLAIENTSAATDITYNGWGGKAGFDPDAATLKGPPVFNYPAVSFTQKVKGQVSSPRIIKPGQSLTDVLVFQAPMNNPDELRLELPASAFGGIGRIKFRISAAMIKR
jgi:hypothetical protein